MVRIRLPDTTEAVLEGRRWRCQSARLESILNSMVAPWGLDPSEAPEEREAREAQIASRILGAEIVETGPTVDPGALEPAESESVSRLPGG